MGTYLAKLHPAHYTSDVAVLVKNPCGTQKRVPRSKNDYHNGIQLVNQMSLQRSTNLYAHR